MSIKLLPCPFCGDEAEIERLGDHSRSTIYRCTSCGASLETGEEWDHGKDWNKRADISGQLLEQLKAERDEADRRAGAAERNFAALQERHKTLMGQREMIGSRLSKIEDVIADPTKVHINMLVGEIAKISMEHCAHIHGEEMVVLWNKAKQEQA